MNLDQYEAKFKEKKGKLKQKYVKPISDDDLQYSKSKF